MRFLALLAMVAALGAAEEPRRLDGATVLLTAAPGALVVTGRGALLRAEQPVTLSAPITLQLAGAMGLEASVVASSLRAVNDDDWRASQTLAGTRHDALIDFPGSAMGTPQERARWKIAGSDDNWDQVSIQWDGWLHNDVTVDLATISDDGSRVWLDRHGDGQVHDGEWCSNGWGVGHGMTRAVLQTQVPPGCWRIRVQWEDGEGPNGCLLVWNHPRLGREVGEGWRVVPAEAFTMPPSLSLQGPITVATSIQGQGVVRLETGTTLACAPSGAQVVVAGAVACTGDLALRDLRLAPDERQATVLTVAGRLHLGCLSGPGAFALAHGRLELPPCDPGTAVTGTGTLAATGELQLGRLAESVAVELAPGAKVSTPERVLACAVTASPLTTLVPLSSDLAAAVEVDLALDLAAPPGARFGLGLWRTDPHGRWFQRILPGMLAPGHHRRTVIIDGQAPLVPGLEGGEWTCAAAAECRGLGLLLYGLGAAQGTVRVDARVGPARRSIQPLPRLLDLACDPSQAATGRRWSAALRPDPYPADPFDPAAFRLDLVVSDPLGGEQRYAGFHDQPMVRSERGDREILTATGRPSFRVRFRPRQAGRHQLRVEARFHDGTRISRCLPDLEVQGGAWDDIVRVDGRDPRFFSAGGAFVWPLGQNLNSTYDLRCRDCLGTKLTPDRGSYVREAQLARLRAHGGNAAEVWLSPWNLGLEWIPRWPGFQGAGRFHEGNAWALDRLLDQAESLGMRLNLVLFNHGMARAGAEAEEDWRWHPYNKAQGGWLEQPQQLFTDERARLQQERYFRYLAARIADSPAVLGWKLWAEVNLAQVGDGERQAWHAWAAEAMRRCDPWHHPVTTHWCGDWQAVDPVIAAQPGMAYLTIDAYHDEGTAVAELLAASVRDVHAPEAGPGRFGKPIMVTEYGGSPGACSPPRLEAEHALGPWVGLVTGHAASPMLWWFEWIDQGERYAPYRAVSAFIAHEDLRGREAVGAELPCQHGVAKLWSRCWQRPGRVLGYLLDRDWGLAGGEGQAIAGATLRLGAQIPAGAMHLEWWDADQGVIRAQQDVLHPGGPMDLHPPEFRRHLAFKVWRVSEKVASRR